MSTQIQKSAKICLFGEGSVGKTSLIRRFVEDKYDDKYITTIGTKVSKKKINLKHPLKENVETTMTFMVWDIMGQRGFRSLLQDSYFDGASGAIGVCDITRKETFTELKSWIESILKSCGDIPIIIVGNKSDLADKAEVQIQDLNDLAMKNVESGFRDDLQKFAEMGCVPYVLTSAKTGENVEEVFWRMGVMLQ